MAVSAAAGFCVWAGLSLIGGVREAWDAPAYWLIGLPILAVVSGIAGYVVPVRVWRWPAFIGLGQILGMIVLNPDAGWGLLPLMLAVVMVPLIIILTIPALIGGSIARGGWDRALLA
jgi:hypothetical protein